jgi:hypothetical protein
VPDDGHETVVESKFDVYRTRLKNQEDYWIGSRRVDVQAGAGIEVVVHQHVDKDVVHVIDERWAFDEEAFRRCRADRVLEVDVRIDVRHGAPEWMSFVHDSTLDPLAYVL